jgi:hypothetical protein
MVIRKDNLHRSIERSLAVVLTTAALSKTQAQFLNSRQSNLGPFDPRDLFALLILVELVLALWLVVGGFDRIRFICGIGCFALFLVFSLYEVSQLAPSCGCFGRARVPPAITATFDLTVVIALWFTHRDHVLCTAIWKHRKGFATGSGLVFLAGLAIADARTHRPSEANAGIEPLVLDPIAWVNRPFPLFDSIDGASVMERGRWLLVFYHFDCDACRNAIPKYRARASARNNAKAPPSSRAASTRAMPRSTGLSSKSSTSPSDPKRRSS